MNNYAFLCVREGRGDEFVVLRNLVCCDLSLDEIMDISQIINYIVINCFFGQFGLKLTSV